MWSRLRKLVGAGGEAESQPDAVHAHETSHPLEVTDASFEELVLGADRPVVLDFWADWCQPCTIMAAHLGFLAQEFGDQIIVASLDVEENRDTPAKYGVQGLPTLIIFRDGDEIDRQMGVADYDSLEHRVAHVLSQSEPKATELSEQASDAAGVEDSTNARRGTK